MRGRDGVLISPVGGDYSSRVTPSGKETIRLRRFNLALLPPIDFALIDRATAQKTSQKDQSNADKPHKKARSFGVPSSDDGDNS